MNLIYTIISFLFAICILIVFHELGHYWVARLCNVKVLRFSLGFGKILYSRRFGKDQTEWVIAALPLGGYVKMLDLREHVGENADKPIAPVDLEREFTSQSVWKRMAIVAAGPVANFLLAIVLFSALYMLGVPEPIAKLGEPTPSTQAYQAGVRGGELVVAINGKPIQLWSELRWEMLQHVLDKQPATLTLVTPSSDQPHQMILQLDQIAPEDLQADFLGKLGLKLAFPKPQLGVVQPGGPAERAGLKDGDTVLEIDGKKIIDSLDLIETIRSAPNKLLHFIVNRAGPSGDKRLEFSVTPDAVTDHGQTIGRLNVEVRAVPEMQIHHDSLFTALLKASERTWSTSVLTIKTLAKMLVGEVSLKNITGPLTIADYAGQTAKSGWISYISFLALISISLGVMNLLPIPVLDGGHLLYYSLEVFLGRPVPPRFWEITQRAGIAILLLLMAVALYNDIVRLLPAF